MRRVTLTGFTKKPCLLDLDRNDAVENDKGAQHGNHHVELTRIEDGHLGGLASSRLRELYRVISLKFERVGPRSTWSVWLTTLEANVVQRK